MTEEELLENFPTLYHMAEGGSWPSIRTRGLLSTSQLLDLYGYTGDARNQIERCHRPESVKVNCAGLPDALIRDQKPMSDAGLQRALPDDISPEEWYAVLNSKTFFWTSENRLLRLLNARPYRDKSHDVLTVSTEEVVSRHKGDILLCPMNSGCTKPFPHRRDRTTFRSIEDYPYDYWKRKRPVWDAVVEVAVEGGVPNIAGCVVAVRKMQGDTVIRTIWPK